MGILLFLKYLDLLSESSNFFAAQLSKFFGINAIGVNQASATSAADLESNNPKQSK
jgi:hypothetical protein